MPVNDASVIASATSSPTSSTSSSSSSASNAISSQEQEFLKLLTTSLQQQDPTSPIDNNTIMTQESTLASLQAGLATQASIQSAANAIAASQTSSAGSLVGAYVTVAGNQTTMTAGGADISYTLPSAAANATVTITDASGNVVYSAAGPTNEGLNTVVWGGAETSGSTAANGATFNFSVTATDSSGNPITPTTATAGVVQSVLINNGVLSLQLKGLSSPVLYSNVTSISQAPTVSNTSG